MGSVDSLDVFYPPCGPCALCGHHDKRHRLWDAIMDTEGDWVDEECASEFGVSIEHVRAVRRIRPYREDSREDG